MYISLSLRKRQPIALDVTIRAQHLSAEQQLTVLGVIISDNLSWESQSCKVRAKMSSRMAAICCFGRSLTFNTCLIVFNTCLIAFSPSPGFLPFSQGNSSLSITKDMDKVLLRCAQIIHSQCDIKLSSVTMKICGLCDFATLVFMRNIIAMFYQLRSSASSCPVQFYSSHNTYAFSSNKLLLSQVKRSVDNHYFFVTGARHWNKLSNSTSVLTEINIFKKRLLVFIFNLLI